MDPFPPRGVDEGDFVDFCFAVNVSDAQLT